MHDEESPAEIRDRDLEKARSQALWTEAVAWLARDMHPTFVEEAKILRQMKPSGWMIPHHFTAGMMIRNRLREGGFGEKAFGIENLDNIYIEILNEALDW
jgi:predicted Rdx family selenoprotein